MGDIKKLLAHEQLEPRSITPNALWVDLCENVHIHFRNIRFDMSIKEFCQFMAGMHNLWKAAEQQIEIGKFEEGDPNILNHMRFNEAFSNSSDYYPNRFLVEWNKDGTYHIHYRDLRLHLSQDEFEDFQRAFRNAEVVKKEFIPFSEKYGPFEKGKAVRKTVDLMDIQPYDNGHKPFAPCADHDHEPGILKVMELIKEGKSILPILVNSQGQRLDGFKRYVAYKRLFITKVDVYVDDEAPMGGQDRMSWIEGNDNG